MYTQLLPQGAPKVLAVKLSVIGERSVRSNHPWIFTDSIEKINKEGMPGDIAIIFSHSKNKAIGVGLYDPDSPIRIKMVHFNGGATLNKVFFSEKIKKASYQSIELEANPDLIANISKTRSDNQVLVAFAAETLPLNNETIEAAKVRISPINFFASTPPSRRTFLKTRSFDWIPFVPS